MDQVLTGVKKMAGFQSITLYHDDNYETVGSFSIWDTRADAEGATPGMRDMAQRQVQELLTASPTTEIYEVYSEPVQTFPIGKP
jgi:heme-degrading monooxygenase HmoA